MAIIDILKKAEKGVELPTGKIESIYPEPAAKAARDFFMTKAKIETVRM